MGRKRTVHLNLPTGMRARVAADSLVLSGVEAVAGDLRHRQAWWCRLPPPGSDGPHPFDPDPPSAVRRDRSYAPAKA